MTEKLAVNTKNMSHKLPVIALCLGMLILFQCTTEKKVEYTLPPDWTEHDKKTFLVTLESGKLLYRDHCSSCHGIFGPAKKDSPDFTTMQLPDFTKIKRDRYLARIFRTDPISHKVFLKMGRDELNLAIGFLTYYRREAPVK